MTEPTQEPVQGDSTPDGTTGPVRQSDVSSQDGARADLPVRRRVQPSTLILAALLTMASFWALAAARSIAIPCVLAILLHVMLGPIVVWLGRVYIPRVIAAAMVILVVVGVLFVGLAYAAEPAQVWVTRLPNTVRRIEFELRDLKRPIQAINEASKEVEALAGVDDETSVKVKVEDAPTLTSALFDNARGFVLGFLLTAFFLFFLLAYGDMLLRKVVKVAPLYREKQMVLEIVGEVQSDVSRYVMTTTAINLALGGAIALAMHLLEMPNPLLWGLMAALLNFMPYIGAIVGIAVVWLAAVAAVDAVDAPGRPFVVAGTYFVLTALEGQVITPMIHGRRLLLNPIVVFVGLVFWGWLWGVPGALLAVPILAVTKIVCDRLPSLAPVGELLGR